VSELLLYGCAKSRELNGAERSRSLVQEVVEVIITEF
jgi:hypothetical protein